MESQGSGSPMGKNLFGEGAIAQQTSRTLYWVFGYGLKIRKSGKSGRMTWKGLLEFT